MLRLLLVYTLFMAVTFVCAAQALASRVFPVPGAPYNRTPAQHKQKVTNLTNLVSFSNSTVPSSGKNAMTCIHTVWRCNAEFYRYMYIFVHVQRYCKAFWNKFTLHKAANRKERAMEVMETHWDVPFGGWIPMFSNRSLWVIGNTIASTSWTVE